MEKPNQKELLEMRATPADLFGRILKNIHILAVKKARRQFFISEGFSFLSIVLFVTASFWFYRDLNSSGFLSSLHLIFSDGSLVALYWKDFSAMLLEVLPIASAVAFIASLMAVLISFGYFLRSRTKTKTIFKNNFARS